MSEAPEHHLHLEYDQDLDETWTWYLDSTKATAKTLVGWTATLEIRSGDRTTTPLLSLAPGAGLTLGGAAGTIRVEMTEAQIHALSVDSGRWHLVMTDAGGDNHVIAKGPWTRHKD